MPTSASSQGCSHGQQSPTVGPSSAPASPPVSPTSPDSRPFLPSPSQPAALLRDDDVRSIDERTLGSWRYHDVDDPATVAPTPIGTPSASRRPSCVKLSTAFPNESTKAIDILEEHADEPVSQTIKQVEQDSTPSKPPFAPLEEKAENEKSTDSPSSDEPTLPTEAPQEPSHGRLIPLRQFLIVYACLSVAVLLTSLDQTIVACLLPTIASDFGAAKDISWVGTAFLLTNTAFSPIYGRMSDVFGRRALFLFAQVIFIIGTAMCGAAPSMTVLIVGRAIAGIGGGGLFSMVHICVSDVVSLRQRGKYHGILSAINGLGSVIGPVVGGVFGQSVSWRWAFYFQLPIIGVAMVVSFFFLPSIGKSDRGLLKSKVMNIDYLGITLLLAGCLLFLTSLNQLSPPSSTFSNNGLVTGFFVGGIVLLCLFVLCEHYARQPIMPLKIFRNLSVDIIFALNAGFGYVFYASIYYIPVFFQVAAGQGVVQSSLSLMPVVLASIVLSWFTGLMTSVTGNYKISLVIAYVFMLIGSVLVYTQFKQDISSAKEIIYMLILGIGFGAQMQNTLVAAQSATRQSEVAMTTAVRNFFRNIGGVIGLAVSGTVLNAGLARRLDNTLGAELSDDLLDSVQASPLKVYNLPQRAVPYQAQIIDAYVKALNIIFLIFVPISVLCLIGGVVFPEYELTREPDGTPKRKRNQSLDLVYWTRRMTGASRRKEKAKEEEEEEEKKKETRRCEDKV